MRQRLEGICAAAGCSLQRLDLQVITVPTLRLDLPPDRDRLLQTVESLKPRLLILDPFVRLHRIDENASGEVAPLLAYLPELQRRYEPPITLELVQRETALALQLRTSSKPEGPASKALTADRWIWARRAAAK